MADPETNLSTSDEYRSRPFLPAFARELARLYGRRISIFGKRIRLLALLLLVWSFVLVIGSICSSSIGWLILGATVLAIGFLPIAWGFAASADSRPDGFWQRLLTGGRVFLGPVFLWVMIYSSLSPESSLRQWPAVPRPAKMKASVRSAASGSTLPLPKTSTPSRPIDQQTDAIERTSEINVLWIAPSLKHEGTVIGGVSAIRFHFRRVPTKTAPLQIGVVEDQPTGAGPSLRAALWQAAIVAALQRNDDLSGVELTIHLQGQMDGPSAGGIFCLALLSLLDGQPLPSDVAMTGTVLPDGTIGQVAGVPQKLQAAAARGCKRIVIPSFLRFHHDLATKTQVDIRKLAAELGLTLYPAESIEEAYRIVQGLPSKDSGRVDRLREYLPGELEEWLKQSYTTYLESGDRIFEGASEADQRDLIGNSVVQLRSNAQSAYGAGKLLEAMNAALLWNSALQGREATRRSLVEMNQSTQSQDQVDPQKFLTALETTIKRQVAQLPSELQLARDMADKLQPHAAQLFVQIGTQAGMEAVRDLLHLRLQRQLDSYGTKDSTPPSSGLSLDLRVVAILNHRAEELIQINLIQSYLSDWSRDQQHMAGLLASGAEAQPRTRNIEQFFYAASLAAQETTRQEVEQLGLSISVAPAAIATVLKESDPEYTAQDYLRRLSDQLHLQLKVFPEDSRQRQFLEVLNAQIFAHRIAEAAGTRVRWTELAARFPETGGPIEYGRPEVLSFMLRRARDSALQNLTSCLDRQIPCTEAVRQFESAECQRDEAGVDKVSVLVNYWKASLQAQALRMMFNDSRRN